MGKSSLKDYRKGVEKKEDDDNNRTINFFL